MTKIAIRVQGCGANQGEAAALSGKIRQMGLDLATPEQEADAYMLHACTVKGDEDPLNEAKQSLLKFPDRPIVISGCVTPELRTKLENLSPNVQVTKNWDDSAQWAIETFKPQMGTILTGERQLDLSDELGRIGTVTISSGCLDRCAFCSTVRVKGKLQSISPDQIFAEVAALVRRGAMEIRLAGQDTACYGFDIGTNLPALLRRLVALPGDFRIRLGMGNPRHIIGMEEEFAELLHHPKVYQFLHLPVQAGSDQTLAAMKRGHSQGDFAQLWQRLKMMVPELTLSTDIIVGHPGEEDRDFQQTLDLVREIRPHFCNITRFVPRAKTVAATLKAPASNIAKERSKALSEVYRQIATELHASWIGKEVSASPLELGPKEGQWCGRTQHYLKVVASGELPSTLAQKLLITDHSNFGLFGRVLP